MFNSILANFSSSLSTYSYCGGVRRVRHRSILYRQAARVCGSCRLGSLFVGRDGHCHYLAWFQELRIPAGSLQDAGSQGLDALIHGLAGVVLDVEENLAMGIGPIIFGNGAFESP